MIQLRWVERIGQYQNRTDPPQPITERILQYRTWVWYAGADGNLHAEHDAFKPYWTDWIDVPTVKEP